MNEVVQLNKVINQQHLNILLIHFKPQLIQINKILTEDNSSDSQLTLILYLRLLNNKLSFDRFDAQLVRIRLRDIINIGGREIVSERRFKYEGRCVIGSLM